MLLHAIFDGEACVWHDQSRNMHLWALRTSSVPEGTLLLDENHIELLGGDELTIWNEADRILFKGTLDPDRFSEWTPFSLQSNRVCTWLAARWYDISLTKREWLRIFLDGMPRIGDTWVAWTQRGREPEAWKQFFIRPEGACAHRAQVRRPVLLVNVSEEDR